MTFATSRVNSACPPFARMLTFSEAFELPCSVPGGDQTVRATAASGQSGSAAVTFSDCIVPRFTG